ncbi:MAG: hypothetical protein QM504_08170 [Pseudomonadota bacterium]
MNKKQSTDEDIEGARIDFECHSMSLAKIAKKYKISKSTVHNWSTDYGWEKGKTGRIAELSARDKVITKQEFEENTKDLTGQHKAAVQNRAAFLEKKLLELDDSLSLNQDAADMSLRAMMSVANAEGGTEGIIDMSAIDAHSRATNRNKGGFFGKNPDTAIQINNEPTEAGITYVVKDARVENKD